MASLGADDLRSHLNGVPDEDAVLVRFLAASERHLARILGYSLDDELLFPDGMPEDLQLAVLMLAAHFYENREATLVGVTAQELPFGVQDIVREHRNYTFG